MNVEQVVEHAGDIADETITLSRGMEYINDAIAKINIKTKAKFPFVSNSDDVFVFDETWQRALIVPFVAGRIKTKDSSQFEYEDFYSEFLDALADFKADYMIPEELKSRAGEVWDPVSQTWLTVTSDVYARPPYGWGW